MSEGWKERLAKAVDDDGRSMRAISLAAKCGPNYLTEVFAREKVPSIDKLIRLAAELKVSAAYIVTGVQVTADDEEMFALISDMPEDQKATMRALARQLRAARP